MTCVFTTDKSFWKGSRMRKIMERGQNFRPKAVLDDITTDEDRSWKQHVIAGLSEWAKSIHENFGIDMNSIKEHIIAAATEVQILRNEIINEDQDHTLHIESEEDRRDAKLIAGPQAIIILGGMDKCGDGFAIMCGKYYATIMHRSLEKSHQRIPSAQKDNIIRAQNQYTTNAGITGYDSKNTDNPQED